MKQAGMGHPVQIVRPNTEGGFEVDIEAVEKILLDVKVKDKPVVVISVPGEVRTGRSFLLSLFLLHLSTIEVRDWLRDRDSPLEGFSWRAGSERHTTGVWLWSEVFLVPGPQGDEVAVLLMDTHGLFDIETTPKDSLNLLMFTALISSVQVYNVASNIHEDHLKYLQPLVECAQMVEAETGKKCLFQKMLFLVRDWYFPSEAPFGEKGGKEILNRRLEASSVHTPEQKRLLENIRTAFSQVTCFLMPYPGRKVAAAASTETCLREMEDDFVLSIKELVSSLFAPKNIVEKQILQRSVTCEGLVFCMKRYMDVTNAQFCDPTSILQAVTEVDCMLALMEAKNIHSDGLKKVCDVENPHVRPEKLKDLHKRLRNHVLEDFSNRLKLGGHVQLPHLRRQLEQEIDDTFQQVFEENEAKKTGSFGSAGVFLTTCLLADFGSRLGSTFESRRPTDCDSTKKVEDSDFSPMYKTSLDVQLRQKKAANTIRRRIPFHVQQTRSLSTAQVAWVE